MPSTGAWGASTRAGERGATDLRSGSQVPRCVGVAPVGLRSSIDQGQGRRTASVLAEPKAKLTISWMTLCPVSTGPSSL